MSEKVTVVGAGLMGVGIASVCLKAGFEVVLYDIDETQRIKGQEQVLKLVTKTSDESSEQLSSRFKTTNDIKDAAGSLIVIEAIVENLSIKQSVFKQLEDVVDTNTILASNTSGISITEIASSCTHKERVIGTHFFNPALRMPLVEVINGEATSKEVLDRTINFINKLEKRPIVVKDVPGFVVNRIITPMLIEAMKSLEANIATKEDIDHSLKLAMNHPMGPLELSDYIGLDTLLHFMDHTYEVSGDPAFKAPNILREYVESGHTGVKSGKGFYTYNDARTKVTSKSS